MNYCVMRVLTGFAWIVSWTAINVASASEYSFIPLGDLSGGRFDSLATGVSADGSVVVGVGDSANGREAFRWTAAEGMIGLGDLPGGTLESIARGVSADGSVIAGFSNSANGREAFRWTAAEGMKGLGDLEGGDFDSYALGISADGSAIVGVGSMGNGTRAFRWTTQRGMAGLSQYPGSSTLVGHEAWAVSADGSVVVGKSYRGSRDFEAFRWTSAGGIKTLDKMVIARGISADGSVVVGFGLGVQYGADGYGQAYRWTAADGPIRLGAIPGAPLYSEAWGVSADGSVVVGHSWHRASYWNENLGLVILRDYLIANGVENVADWKMEHAVAVSADGRTVVGYGENASAPSEAWAARIPEPPKWNSNANGAWSDPAHWPTGVPNRVGASAVFENTITAPRNITADVPITVGYLGINNINSYTISGNHPITLDTVSGHVNLHVTRGSHSISAPLTLADDAIINVLLPSSQLSIEEGIDGLGAMVNKDGAGTLTLNEISAAGLTIDSGTVVLSPNEPNEVSVLGTLALSGTPFVPTARLDLNGAAVIDYTGRSPAALISTLLVMGRGGAGRENGDWTGTVGITSSAAAAVNARGHSRAIGFAENSAMPLGPLTNFRGQAVDETSILMAYTRAGDANLDGVVNDNDVTVVGAMYGQFGNRLSWAVGDFNYDFRVDEDDVTIVGAFYDPAAEPLLIPESAEPLIGPPAEPGANGVAAVPEPATFLLLPLGAALGALVVGASHWRRRALFR